LAILLDLIACLLALLLTIEDRLILGVVDQIILASDLVIDPSDLVFGVCVSKETLDAGPDLLKEAAEPIPSFLEQAYENGPAIGDEMGGL
jgi:hypothetical protein